MADCDPREADKVIAADEKIYSICTLVTNKDEYIGMIESFVDKGFCGEVCEYLYLDNTNGNKYDSYSGYNILLRSARGKFIILCHQDVRLDFDDIKSLDARIFEISQLDSMWGLLGNAGGDASGKLAIRITDKNGDDTSVGKFPVKVNSLDENFIIAKASANLALSGNISGFHLYGADMCLVASVLGYSSYVIDFHLRHTGAGNMLGFSEVRNLFVNKYNEAFSSRWVITTCTKLFVTGNRLAMYIFNSRKGYLIAKACGIIKSK